MKRYGFGGYSFAFILALLVHVLIVIGIIIAGMDYSKPKKPGSGGSEIINAQMIDLDSISGSSGGKQLANEQRKAVENAERQAREREAAEKIEQSRREAQEKQEQVKEALRIAKEQKAREEAEKRAEEQRIAEEKARIAEEKRLAEEKALKLKAEEEARKKAEAEARKKSEEEAKKKAEAEAKKKAEAEAKKKAEAEAKKKAEAEARKKTNQELDDFLNSQLEGVSGTGKGGNNAQSSSRQGSGSSASGGSVNSGDRNAYQLKLQSYLQGKIQGNDSMNGRTVRLTFKVSRNGLVYSIAGCQGDAQVCSALIRAITVSCQNRIPPIPASIYGDGEVSLSYTFKSR